MLKTLASYSTSLLSSVLHLKFCISLKSNNGKSGSEVNTGIRISSQYWLTYWYQIRIFPFMLLVTIKTFHIHNTKIIMAIVVWQLCWHNRNILCSSDTTSENTFLMLLSLFYSWDSHLWSLQIFYFPQTSWGVSYQIFVISDKKFVMHQKVIYIYI